MFSERGDRVKVLAITGYKPNELGIYRRDAPEIEYIKHTIKKRLIAFLDEGLEWVVLSGQPGVEQWTAETVIQLKEEWPHLKLAVLPPFLNQEKIWPEDAQERYHALLQQADFTEAISKREYENPGQLRAKNDFIIMKTDALLLMYNEEQPGTPKYYLEAAERRSQRDNYPIYWITPDELQEAVEEANSHHDFLE